MDRRVEQSLHRAAYLTLQNLRGRPVGRFIRELQQRERFDATALRRLREAELADALSYAHANVPFYSSGLWGQFLSRSDAKSK